ncbi:siderophore synthetase component [Isoptericola sp. CG 20/1183]|uniref:Siderophore synthetase component n=1 Tax=Isoptericola halotolerans TaxID=300560 RepID=A0ABX5EEH7_9MICO|nr:MULTISPECIES: GNAT family N-acetyltransferase [Isoptericola]PRZ07100.1 siderophore synthetase component [Isoptericola halotolerans]PRZ07228.1 siderophore synthetase component [Isoptericola sp. CG 20/1183]
MSATTASAVVPAAERAVFVAPTGLGDLTFTAVSPVRDAATVQSWLTHPASSAWAMADLDVDGVRDYLAAVAADEAQEGWLGRLDGEPVVYTETYDPARVLLTAVHAAEPGDIGMHLLVAPPPDEPARRRTGLTDAVMGAVVRFCLTDVAAGGRGGARVVVEPDVTNAKIAAKNAAAGFRVLREVPVTDAGRTKTAALSVCTRADFAASPLGAGTPVAAHLRGDLAEVAHRHLAAKALAELAHERLFAPAPDGPAGSGRYRLDLAGASYAFAARTFALEHWVVDPASITRTSPDGAALPVDVLDLVAELQPLLQVPDALLATYLEELSSTLAAAMAKRERELTGVTPNAARLVAGLTAPVPAAREEDHRRTAGTFQAVEGAMSEGHPGFLANNGRIGFSLDDYAAFAPERSGRLRLQWVAARREHTHLALGGDQTEDALYGAELSGAERAAFAGRLTTRGLDPADYLYLPVHPWQAQHRLPITFAADVARDDLVPLGPGADEYTPQQSIRTMFNRTRPERHYVKVALAIQNMGFLRGLSPAYMRATPAINDWVAGLVEGDSTLTGSGFGVLRELASVGYTGDVYHRTPQPNAHRKMLAALWRESPLPRTAPGERLATMASLLHRDASGAAVVTGLVRASGVGAEAWLRAYLDAYLYPLVHCLRAHDLAFMPHGENLVLVLRDGVVRRAFMKDIGEEVALLSDRALAAGTLPDDVARVVAPVDDAEKALAIFTDVFDGVLRHLAGILAVDGVLGEDRFWALVGECLDRHDAEHPGLDSGVDLRAARFAHSCLNRLQLRNTLQMVDLADQSSSLIYAGTLANPVARP